MDDESAPKPGHLLPAGDEATVDAGTADIDDEARQFGGPPPAPLPGAPAAGTPLTRAGQAGRKRPWHSSTAARRVVPPAAGEETLEPERRFSRPMIAVFTVLALLAVSGGVVASVKLIDGYDDLVENPLAGPTVRPKEPPPVEPLPQPTVTVTATPVPDAVKLKQNKLYTVGRLPRVKCQVSKVAPTTKAAVAKYYRALLPCLNRAWAPVVRKAGYEFRAPKLAMYEDYGATECSGVGVSDTAFYCGRDETITVQWQEDIKNFRRSRSFGRTWMLDTLAHEYGHHVQHLTTIMTASASRVQWALTKEAELAESRRLELQASCLGAAFLGSDRYSLGLTGTRYKVWEYYAKHSGDEYNRDKVRDHGSRKNNGLWALAGFASASPKSCNTFKAPAARVS